MIPEYVFQKFTFSSISLLNFRFIAWFKPNVGWGGGIAELLSRVTTNTKISCKLGINDLNVHQDATLLYHDSKAGKLKIIPVVNSPSSIDKLLI